MCPLSRRNPRPCRRGWGVCPLSRRYPRPCPGGGGALNNWVQYCKELMCFAQGHKTVPCVGIEPGTSLHNRSPGNIHTWIICTLQGWVSCRSIRTLDPCPGGTRSQNVNLHQTRFNCSKSITSQLNIISLHSRMVLT